MNKRVMSITGILMVLVGVLWTLQGLDILGGSSMSGSMMWAVIGPITAAIGAAMTYAARRTDQP
jgi:hypothetical protein